MSRTQELLNHSGRNASTGFSIPSIILVCLITHTSPGFGQCTAPSFTPATNVAAANGPFTMAVADLNAETKPDCDVRNINGSRVSILVRNGAGSFRLGGCFGVSTAPATAAAGDFNSDGKVGLAIENQTSFGNGDMSNLIG